MANQFKFCVGKFTVFKGLKQEKEKNPEIPTSLVNCSREEVVAEVYST